MKIRRRFFKKDARYIALQELNGEGKYRRERASLDLSSLESDTDTPSLKKRLSIVFTRRPSSRLSLTSTTQWKRASISRAVTATRDALAGMPLYRRDSHYSSSRYSDDSDADDDDEEVDEPVQRTASAGAVEGIKKRTSWVQSWMATPAPEFGCTFTIAHSTLFVGVSA
ncbi:hypothetical protein ISF_01913 [Cordyceps fumosorosea ARSEF 2679]|uniref:Uncharacterized protein n=1 Tax=Cordyceps fumosorosea (strain ARSEF 2679) TaxID=1081104 RepID=A0A162JN79_CORFA|nr:hypothetical protein ISF_01913 [Cordyceps fumosorosea ARSEF 2679]OAA71362.1 hypothetical protein ISF_01913 [Cordyceps fumosorosea ARSEF 2679]